MPLKTVAIAVTFILAAGIASACSQHSKQTQSCAAGTVWDAEMQKCTKQVTG